jgi:hypothetical protein
LQEVTLELQEQDLEIWVAILDNQEVSLLQVSDHLWDLAIIQQIWVLQIQQ